MIVSCHSTFTGTDIAIIEMEIVLGRKGYAGEILMDLSKTFDILNYDHLIAKLHANGFLEESYKFSKSKMTNHWQRTKVNISFPSLSKPL